MILTSLACLPIPPLISSSVSNANRHNSQPFNPPKRSVERMPHGIDTNTCFQIFLFEQLRAIVRFYKINGLQLAYIIQTKRNVQNAALFRFLNSATSVFKPTTSCLKRAIVSIWVTACSFGISYSSASGQNIFYQNGSVHLEQRSRLANY